LAPSALPSLSLSDGYPARPNIHVSSKHLIQHFCCKNEDIVLSCRSSLCKGFGGSSPFSPFPPPSIYTHGKCDLTYVLMMYLGWHS
jgi:hypothetical protein